MRANWETFFILYGAGLVAGMLFGRGPGLLVMVAAVLALMPLLAVRRKYSFLLVAAAFALGLMMAMRIPPMPEPLPATSVRMDAVVVSRPVPYESYQRMVVRPEKPTRYTERILVYLPPGIQVRQGDTLTLSGKLSTIKGPRNPGDPDRRRLLACDNIYCQLKVKKEGVISYAHRPLSWQERWRASFAEAASSLPKDEAAILAGILWGNTEGMEEEDVSLFRETGLLHIFAVSGMNVAYLMLLMAGLAGLAGLGKKQQVAGGILLVAVYGTLIGWPVSVVRAALMAFLGALAYAAGRQRETDQVLFLSGFLMLAIRPQWIASPSFQLTMAATWGLIRVYPWLSRGLGTWAQNPLARMLLPVLGAQMAVWPLIVYYFNLVAPVSIPANLLVTHLVGGVVMLGTLGLLVAPLSMGFIFLLPAAALLRLVLELTRFVHWLPHGYWWVVSPPVWLIVCYYALLWLLAGGRDRYLQQVKMRGYPAWPALGLALVFLFTAVPRVHTGDLEITVVDVGQGDCIHIRTPGGKSILVDGGGSSQFPVGRLTVVPYLHRQGINRLEMAVNTHPHDDHLLGLKEMLKEVPVHYIARPLALQGHKAYEEMDVDIRGTGGEVLWLEKGDVFRVDGVSFRVLWPGEKPGVDDNNSSMVLLVEYRGSRALLMGDAEAPVTRALTAEGLSPVDFIKIGHHGSKNAVDEHFYQQIRPNLAVISVGAGNPFGHPAPALLHELEKQGIKTLRTDQVGAVRLVTRGSGWEVTCYRQDS